MAKEKIIVLKVDSKDAVKNTEAVTDELNVATDSTKELSSGLLDSAKNFKVMGVSINGVIKGLKMLRISLIATGIGAIVVAVGALASAFLSTQKGADTLTKILTPLSEVLGTIWGIVQQLGEGLFDMVNGDIQGGFDKMAGAVENFGDKMEEAYERGRLMADLMIEIEQLSSVESLTLSRLARQRSEYRAIIDDDTRSKKEQLEALRNLEAVDNAISDVKIHRLRQELDLKEKEMEANDTDLAAKKERNDILQQIEEAEKERFDKAKVRSLAARRLAAGGGEDGTKGEVNPITGLTTKGLTDIASEQNVIIGETTDLVIANDQRQTRMASEQANARIKIAEEEAAAKQAGWKATAQAITTLSDIAGKETVAGKALAISAALINTYTGITASLKVGGFAGIAQSVAVGLAGFAAVANIVNTKVPGGHGDASRPSAGLPTSPQAPEFNIVGQSDTNQLAQTINARDSQPVKAYVVGSEMSSQQALDRNVVENATVIG